MCRHTDDDRKRMVLMSAALAYFTCCWPTARPSQTQHTQKNKSRLTNTTSETEKTGGTFPRNANHHRQHEMNRHTHREKTSYLLLQALMSRNIYRFENNSSNVTRRQNGDVAGWTRSVSTSPTTTNYFTKKFPLRHYYRSLDI